VTYTYGDKEGSSLSSASGTPREVAGWVRVAGPPGQGERQAHMRRGGLAVARARAARGVVACGGRTWSVRVVGIDVVSCVRMHNAYFYMEN
jgi:hypothetical protein